MVISSATPFLLLNVFLHFILFLKIIIKLNMFRLPLILRMIHSNFLIFSIKYGLFYPPYLQSAYKNVTISLRFLRLILN
jgi:hypothetical protein